MTPGKPLTRVLAVLDHETDAETLAAAAALARRHGATLEAMACVEPPDDLELLARTVHLEPEELRRRLVEQRRTRMAESVAATLPGESPTLHIAFGKAFVEIVRHVVRHGTDMVVKTAEPLTGLDRFLFASTDHHLMRKCPCGVWLRLAGAREAPATVIAAVDVDEWDASEPETLADLNRRVIRSAMALSGPGGAVHVLHAWDAPGEGLVSAFADGREARAAADRYVREVEAARHMALDALIADLRPAGEAAPRLLPRLARGPARRVIPETARTLGADTVVMGTVARTGLAGVLIGNTAEDILNTVDCSVLTVKPAGFVSPLATG